jgi:conjugative transfer signal peptidase TraF
MSRFGYVMVTYFLTLVVVIASFFHHTPRLMWNGSASAPIGLYWLQAPDMIKVGDLVADRAPTQLARYMSARRYLPLNIPLLKYVGAIAGQTVCRHGLAVAVDGHTIATALATDHAKRPLSVWLGCHVLKAGEIFLLNPNSAESFDGRYFGVTTLTSVTARAKPLWTKSEQ